MYMRRSCKCVNYGHKRGVGVFLSVYLIRTYRWQGQIQKIFDWRGPESRDNHMFNADQTKLLCEQRQEATQKIT